MEEEARLPWHLQLVATSAKAPGDQSGRGGSSLLAYDGELLATLPDAEVLDVCIGLHWTAVVAQAEGQRRCGMASTLIRRHAHSAEPDVPQAGELHTLSGLDLARLACTGQPPLTSVGVAAINALLPPRPELWHDLNAEEVIAAHGKDKTVALIGSFPFIPRLRTRVGRLIVLELDPGPDELPAESAPDILPQADVAALTSMALVNHTLERLLGLCKSTAMVLLLGPSTPLSPILFEHGVDVLSGSIVTDIDRVLTAIKQGANFRQVHRAGVRLVTMYNDG
jgi:uncharacterized protein